jgi:gas vesicle protein
MRYRVLAVLTCVAIGAAIGGVAALIDAPSHPHDDSDADEREQLMRGVDDARRTGRRLVVNLEAIRKAGL